MAEMPRARSLDEVRTFLLENFNSEPLLYSSEIKQRPLDSLRPKISFNCVLVRRRRALVVASLIFEIASVEFLVEVVTALVTCSTWTNAEFLFRGGGLGCRDESSDLGDICEVCHLHGSSPSLLYLHVSCNLLSLAEAVVGGVSPNSALKSLTLHTLHNTYKFEEGKSLEVLIRSASMSNVKELVLRPSDCGPMNLSVENLVRCNTNLEKLTLCSTMEWAQLKDVTYTWTSDSHGRALHVKYSGINFLSAEEHIKPLISSYGGPCLRTLTREYVVKVQM